MLDLEILMEGFRGVLSGSQMKVLKKYLTILDEMVKTKEFDNIPYREDINKVKQESDEE